MGRRNGYRRFRSFRAFHGLLKVAFFACFFGLPVAGNAEPLPDPDTEATMSAMSLDQIALELSNPVTGLRSIAMDMEFTTYQGNLPGAADQDSFRTVFTPSWPIKLKNGKNLLIRATIPINGDQPYWIPASGDDYADFIVRQIPTLDETMGEFDSGHDHLGNVGFDIGYGDVSDNGFINMIGVASQLPASEDGTARRGQWLLGPEFALGQITRWGLYGLRAKHLVNIDGEGSQGLGKLPTNETTVNLFFAYALGNGWLIESNPIILYDWEAVSGNEWTVPIGAGITKTLKNSGVPIKLGVELQHYVVSPDRFGPDWMLQFNFTPVL